jgi:hypothetical protein
MNPCTLCTIKKSELRTQLQSEEFVHKPLRDSTELKEAAYQLGDDTFVIEANPYTRKLAVSHGLSHLSGIVIY